MMKFIPCNKYILTSLLCLHPRLFLAPSLKISSFPVFISQPHPTFNMSSLKDSSFSSGTFPSKNSTLPFWRTELHELDDHRSTEELPTSCDILIIGGGYAGIAAAYHLLCGDEANSGSPRPSIVLAEARQSCSGATARNGNYKSPLLSHPHSMLTDTPRRTPSTFSVLPNSHLH